MVVFITLKSSNLPMKGFENVESQTLKILISVKLYSKDDIKNLEHVFIES